MSAWKFCQSSSFLLLIFLFFHLIPGTTIISISVLAQRRSSPQNSRVNPHQVVIPLGTKIPVEYFEAEKILVTKQETMSLVLLVAANIKSPSGRILIPYGSTIVGKIMPAEKGSQFVAEKIIIKDQKYQDIEQTLEATSEIITRTEIVKIGANTNDFLQKTTLGIGATRVILSMTRNKAIEREVILNNENLKTLAEWILDSSQAEFISINPNQDLTLTLQENLAMR